MLEVVQKLSALPASFPSLEVYCKIIILVWICHVYLQPVIFAINFISVLVIFPKWFFRPLIFLTFKQIRAIISLCSFGVFQGLLFLLFTAADRRQKSWALLLIYHLLLSCLHIRCLLLRVVLFPTSLHSYYIQKVLLFFEDFKVVVILFDLVLLLSDIAFKGLLLLDQQLLFEAFLLYLVGGFLCLVFDVRHQLLKFFLIFVQQFSSLV